MLKKPKNNHSYSLCSLESIPYLTGACQNFLLCCIEGEHFLKCKYLWQHWLPSLNPKTKNLFFTRSEPDRKSKKLQKFGTFTRTNKSVSIGCGDFSGKGSIFYSIKNKTVDIHLTLSTPAYGSSPKLSKLHELFSQPLNTHISLRDLELPKWQIIQHAPFVPPLQWINHNIKKSTFRLKLLTVPYVQHLAWPNAVTQCKRLTFHVYRWWVRTFLN